MTNEDDDVLWLHARRTLSIIELERSSGLSREVLRELVELGSLSPLDARAAEWEFAADCVARLRAGAQLFRDLELETSALALVLSFIERIEQLQAQVLELDAQLPRPRPDQRR
jgi:chaperone modulatory protein CbpM